MDSRCSVIGEKGTQYTGIAKVFPYISYVRGGGCVI